MTKGDTMKKTAKNEWKAFDALSDEQVHAAALGDPDAQPRTDADFKRMKQTSRAKIIRRALGLSQEEFSARYHIPIGTLRDWEQNRCEPDQAARAYLKVIASKPNIVKDVLTPH